MTIRTEGVGKKYGREWIIKGFSYTFSHSTYAVLGNNGSGKSTLLKLIAGITVPTKGRVNYLLEGKELPQDNWATHAVYVAPYTELIEEFTLNEHFRFYHRLKPLAVGYDEFLDQTGLEKADKKYVRDFSSGMKQKLKLALALYSQAEVVFLDEPTSNLDHENATWFLRLLDEKKQGKVILLASNIPREYQTCERQIDVSAFKI